MSGIIPTFYVGLTCKDNSKFGRKLAQRTFCLSETRYGGRSTYECWLHWYR